MAIGGSKSPKGLKLTSHLLAVKQEGLTCPETAVDKSMVSASKGRRGKSGDNWARFKVKALRLVEANTDRYYS